MALAANFVFSFATTLLQVFLPFLSLAFRQILLRGFLNVLLQQCCVITMSFAVTIVASYARPLPHNLPRVLLQLCHKCWSTFVASITTSLPGVLLQIGRDFCWIFAAFIVAILPHVCCYFAASFA
jgi:hypothetical protein